MFASDGIYFQHSLKSLWWAIFLIVGLSNKIKFLTELSSAYLPQNSMLTLPFQSRVQGSWLLCNFRVMLCLLNPSIPSHW